MTRVVERPASKRRPVPLATVELQVGNRGHTNYIWYFSLFCLFCFNLNVVSYSQHSNLNSDSFNIVDTFIVASFSLCLSLLPLLHLPLPLPVLPLLPLSRLVAETYVSYAGG